ncbi:gliding motility-associated C-terminal domain-containing protein [Roseivirga sp.]|uniref:gliding motility-associated C-terminal domain-containing protein n=1 Tax=Roseivirga sp. TaxID=1964215 RepID=UPI002B2685A5|nr:gliding motility-associated C-terminal domain-containing protein [Roseivirga sp.]
MINNKLLLLFIFTIFFFSLNAQVFINGTNSKIVSQGSPSISMNGLDLINEGELRLDGGEVTIRGTKDAYIDGTNSPIFNDLKLRISGDLVIGTHITVNNQFIIEAGGVDLQDYNLLLPKNESKLIGENSNNRVLSSGSGEIIKYYTQQNLKNENVGNLGLMFNDFENSDGLLIKRGHSILPIPFGESITRYYKVSTKMKPQDKLNIGLEYFDDEVLVKDPKLKEQIWIQNNGEWNRTEANLSRGGNANGNIVKAQVEIYESIITVGLYKKLIDKALIPNVFTPNNDGINDYFIIPEIEKLPRAQVKIYNVYGNLLYDQTNYNANPWDGKLSGKTQPFGVYLYQVIDEENPLEFIEGEITIIK